ncbi:MAG: hypothetical protein EBZ48_15280 [Proteobacteria bacterium]|nr:hypothetical protein [Pseudomonadota bacterium]
MGVSPEEIFQLQQGNMIKKTSVDFSMLARYMKTASGPNLLAQGVGQIVKGGRGVANYLHAAGPSGVALAGAGLGAAKNLISPGTDQYGQERGRIGAMLGGAVKGGLAGAALGHGVKHFNPAIQGNMAWGKNLENVYGGAKSGIQGAIEKVFPKSAPAVPTT